MITHTLRKHSKVYHLHSGASLGTWGRPPSWSENGLKEQEKESRLQFPLQLKCGTGLRIFTLHEFKGGRDFCALHFLPVPKKGTHGFSCPDVK